MERRQSTDSRLALIRARHHRNPKLPLPPRAPYLQPGIELLDAVVIAGPAAADCILRLRRELAASSSPSGSAAHSHRRSGSPHQDGIRVPCPRARTLVVMPGKPRCSTDILTEIMFPPGLHVHGMQVFGRPSPHDARKNFTRQLVLGADAYRGDHTLTTVIPSSDGDFESEAEQWKAAHQAALGGLQPTWHPGTGEGGEGVGNGAGTGARLPSSSGGVIADAVYGSW